MKRALDVWILDPFHAGSHASWSRGLSTSLEGEGHRVTMHSLPGRHWKWRMHGAAATWTSLMHSSPVPDVVVTTDMCDVAQLRGLMPRAWAKVKVVCMFHENQLTFPWSPDDPDASNGRDNTYAYINISSCLAADEVWFNSFHHQHLFLEAVDPWMQRMPKPHLKQVREKIKSKSVVMPLGMDFSHWTSPNDLCRDFSHVDTPLVLWNHRWSWDKGTDAWMKFTHEVLERDLAAQFVVLGAAFGRQPEGWESMRDRLGSRCVHWGFLENQQDYVQWLWKAHIVPIHPHQEYFGLSVLEAMRCRTIPWLPEAHAYTETMPESHRYMPCERWADGLADQTWKHWPVTLDAYERKALDYSWEIQGLRASEALLRLTQ